jgi:hypothetical protein
MVGSGFMCFCFHPNNLLHHAYSRHVMHCTA